MVGSNLLLFVRRGRRGGSGGIRWRCSHAAVVRILWAVRFGRIRFEDAGRGGCDYGRVGISFGRRMLGGVDQLVGAVPWMVLVAVVLVLVNGGRRGCG